MKTGWIILGLLMAAAPLATGQTTQAANKLDRSFNRMAVDGMDDLGKVKLIAERKNLGAQLKLANACASSRLYANALRWFSAAADQGSVEAEYQKGRMLLFGCEGGSPDQNVAAKPEEGLRYTYSAATNRYSGAWADMGQALRDGRGCGRNVVAAYAWFSLAGETGDESARKAVNELALVITTEDIRRGREMARQMKVNRWPEMPAVQAQAPAQTALVAQVDIQLKLSGLICSPRGNLVVINNRTLREGESAQLPNVKKELVGVTCKHIEADSVQVQVEGEADERTLFAAQ